MAKTTIFIEESNELLIKKEIAKTKLSKKDIVNIAVHKYLTDITNKKLLEEILKFHMDI